MIASSLVAHRLLGHLLCLAAGSAS